MSLLWKRLFFRMYISPIADGDDPAAGRKLIYNSRRI